MASSETLDAVKREKVGSRDARHLRAAGRIPCSLQGGEGDHINLHIDNEIFLASRRHHVHLYDLDFGGGNMESAVVRELAWDQMGERLDHIEFKRVVRGVATEAEVSITLIGNVKGGIPTLVHDHIQILTIPSLIPDTIEVNIEGMDEGEHLMAGEINMPEGIALASSADLEVVVISGIRIQVEETSDEDEEGEEGQAGEATIE